MKKLLFTLLWFSPLFSMYRTPQTTILSKLKCYGNRPLTDKILVHLFDKKNLKQFTSVDEHGNKYVDWKLYFHTLKTIYGVKPNESNNRKDI